METRVESTTMPRERGGEISPLLIVNTIIRRRWVILSVAVAVGVLAMVPKLRKPDEYIARAQIAAQGADPSQSALRGLAGQFGVAIAGGLSQSPQFYSDLLKSRTILAAVARDTVVFREAGAQPRPLMEVLKISAPTEEERIESAVGAIGGMVTPKISPQTGVLTVTVTTRSRELSLVVLQSLIDELNEFNVRTRQTQASDERRFTEARLGEARMGLRAAEDRLQGFLARNRAIDNSPQLQFDRDRLDREVQFQQQIVTALTQQYEEVRIREVRDTPAITVIDGPAAPTRPTPKALLRRAALGAIFGAFLAILVMIGLELLRRRPDAPNPELEQFLALTSPVRAKLGRLLPSRATAARE